VTQTIKSIIAGLVLGMFILLFISGLVTYFYKDEVSLYLVEELNDHISAEIDVEKVRFSVLKKFPKASVELENVVAYSPQGYFPKIQQFNTDTLFSAQSIFVQFNLADLLNKEYNITDIHFNRGVIRLFVDHLGETNYIFWKQKTGDNKSDFRMDLKGVKITNSDLLYCNNITKTTLKSTIDNLDFEGNFSNQNFLMKIRSEMFVHQLNVEKIDYLKNKNVKVDLKLNIIDKVNQIEEGLLTIEDLEFNVAGEFENVDNKQIDLSVKGQRLPLKSVMDNLPPAVVKDFSSIQGQTGNVSVTMNISGGNINISHPEIQADFLVEKARIFDQKREVSIKDLFVKGNYSNGAKRSPVSTVISFKNFSASIENSRFNGEFKLTNLYDPVVNVNLFTELNLEDINTYFQADTIALLNGYAEANMSYNGKYAQLKNLHFADLFTPDYWVDLTLSNVAFQFKGSPVKLESIHGNIELNRNLKADNLSFKIKGNDFLINGYISQLFDYFQHQKLFNIKASVVSNHINLNQLSLLFKEDKKLNTEPVYRLPEKIAMSLKLDIKDFEVGKFSAKDIQGDLNYKPRMISLHELSFSAMDGYIKSGGVITQMYNNKFLVRMQSRLNKINIHSLFYSFNNFGQDFISNKNLKGNLTGEVFFSSEWNDRLAIDKSTIHSENNITITDGELIDFEPMLGLSKFIDVRELQHIKFSTLKNQITINNNKVYIPQMDIESSAIDIAASGIHGFNNNFTYRLKVLLSDVLSGRLKRSVKRHSEHENIQDDGLGQTSLFLLIEGNPDDYKVKYDRKAAREELKHNIQREKSELKKIFSEEYGWGEGDSSIQDKNSDQTNENFKIEWEEGKIDSTKQRKINKDTEQKFVIEWEEDTIQ